MRWLVPSLLIAFLSAAAAGCEDPDNSLEGSLSSQYDLSFDFVRARHFLKSRQLLVEYIRGSESSEEKPIMVSINPVPDGPGQFTGDSVGVSNSLLPGEPDLPEVTSASVDLDEFTPEKEGAEVRGSLHAMFTNLGSGDAFSLEGHFKTDLDVVSF